jgi:hypothetical protein
VPEQREDTGRAGKAGTASVGTAESVPWGLAGVERPIRLPLTLKPTYSFADQVITAAERAIRVGEHDLTSSILSRLSGRDAK